MKLFVKFAKFFIQFKAIKKCLYQFFELQNGKMKNLPVCVFFYSKKRRLCHPIL